MQRLSPLLLALALGLYTTLGFAESILERFPDAQSLIDEMASEHGFDRGELTELFRQAEYQPAIIEAISRPAESKPWYKYRPIFLTEQRIHGGVKFWDQYAHLLARAQEEFGVPAQIIVAIIGVETFYGRHKGKYRVIDALSTLGFGYPSRSSFFRGQIKEFLLMARDEQRPPLEFLGSYAGAMGMPQFIPSSFRQYAVDFDHDGHRDLWDNPADIIGSVANYFKRFHWKSGEPITTLAQISGKAAERFADGKIQPHIELSELQAAGIAPRKALSPQQVSLLALPVSESEQEYWITLHNFYVITRYNRSPLYAMAVFQLSEAIRTSRAAELRRAARNSG